MIQFMKNNQPYYFNELYYAFSDGAARGFNKANGDKKGSFGVVLLSHDRTELTRQNKAFRGITNNQAEITGAIYAISVLYKSLERRGLLNDQSKRIGIVLCSDSQQVITAIDEWIESWKHRGWKTASKKTPKNIELYRLLDKVINLHNNIDIITMWTRGHILNEDDASYQEFYSEYNDACDNLANEAIVDADLDESKFTNFNELVNSLSSYIEKVK